MDRPGEDSNLPLPVALEDRTIGALATGLPGAAGLFRELGLAACCCAPDCTLAAAAAARRLPLAPLVANLDARAAASRRAAPEETGALIDLIATRYHARHRAELPALIALAASAAAAGDAPQELVELLGALRAGLEEHMLREELRVFPLMRAERGDLLAQPLAAMRGEHEDNAHFLLRAEHLTRCRPPDAAGPDWRRLCDALARFADDVVAHVDLEERALFPRFEGGGAAQATRRPQRS